MERLVTEKGKVYIYTNGSLFKDNNELEFINFGEEGRVFRDGDTAVKVYHDYPEKPVLSGKDIKQMSKIVTKRIVLPNEVIKSDRTRGYTMPFIKGDNSGIYEMDKDTLVEEICNVKDDLKELGKRNIMIGDLRESNYLSTKDKLFLIDSGDYIITDDNCVDLNINTFYDFFMEDIMGMYLFEELSADKALDIFTSMREEIRDKGDLAGYVDDNFNGSISEEVKKLVR